MDMENVIKELHSARRYLEDKEWSDRGASPHIDAINDALAMMKEDCHNCKLECLLQKYDELKEKYDALLKEHESTTFKPHYIDEYGKHFICGFECGSCHEKISRTYHYCPYCGKAVKWE